MDPEPDPAASPASKPPKRSLPAVLALVTGLLLALGPGAAAYVFATGPERFADVDGGTLLLQTDNRCGSFLGTFGGRCISNATATIQYGAEPPSNITWRHSHDWYSARIELDQARATIRLQADQGEWTREVWIFEGRDHTLRISVGDPPELPYVEGRMDGLAVLLGIVALPGAMLAIGAAAWLTTGRAGAATFTRGMTILWLVLIVLLTLIALFQAALGIGLLLGAVWFWWILRMTNQWIGQVDARERGA